MSDPRDELTVAVQHGRITPNDAEAKLQELGLAPLAPQPDTADFDPMQEVWWTLPMVVAWIAWRAATDVGDAWDKFRSEGSYWEYRRWRLGFDGEVNEGWLLQPRPPASISILTLKEIDQRERGTTPQGAISIESAKAALWRALGNGTITATGKVNSLAPRIAIEKHEWRDLVDVEISGRDEVRSGKLGLPALSGYVELAFERREIVARWKPRHSHREALYLPETISPHAPGHMPLYCAAQWVATQGGAIAFEPQDADVWARAFSELLARISSNEIIVTGMQNGKRERIDGHVFASILVDYPFAEPSFEMILMDELHLQSYPYLDDEHWRDGMDDSLQDRSGPHWSMLMVANADVARWWPFKESQAREAPVSRAGRPSLMPLVLAEFDERQRRGELAGRISEIAAALEVWIREAHPNAHPPTAGSIANALRLKGRWATK